MIFPKVRPVVAKPDFVDNVVPAEEACGIEINEAFLGSCNNGRIEDLRVGAEIIKGKKVSDKVRFLVVPASQSYLPSGVERRTDRHLYGSRRYRDESELQCMLGKLPGCHWRK